MAFELTGVIDVREGRAVHARGGHRARYEPVSALAGVAIAAGDAEALASHYVDRLGIQTLYVADLDAILGGAVQDELLCGLAAAGTPLWIDTGIRSVDSASRAFDLGATRVVVGLETLPSFETLEDICSKIGGDRVVFSLDLRNGQPLTREPAIQSMSATALAARAADAGARTLVVLDLARVGMGAGLDIALLTNINESAPGLVSFAGGGVRDWNDLVSLSNAGCSGALVATALQNGTLTAAHITAARDLDLHLEPGT
ncbi:MAG TPA: HisA/HisF-related TIM barrel protein [Vicinamibacterales bacterium]